MGLLEKFKDLFTDPYDDDNSNDNEQVKEEEITVIEEKPEENKLPTFMREKIAKEEMEKKESKTDVSDQEDLKNTNKFRFPIDYDDMDYVAKRVNLDDTDYGYYPKEEIKEQEVKREVRVTSKTKVEPYSKGNKNKKEEEKKFIATPIISPVYGVLNKNYQKDEVKSKDDNYVIQRSSKKIDFESVRNKAFGTLSDDIKENMCENCEFLREIKDSIKLETISENDLLYDMTKDTDKLNDVDSKMDNYEDFGVEYDNDVRIVNHNDEDDVVATKIEGKEDNLGDYADFDLEDELMNDKGTSKDETDLDDLEITDDLFSLIDSMYTEKED